ncbi:PIN domain-containing protein [Ilumatobacter sp.]|uniref:PIN domain-containing protein n=1 Tax=Ilumatobacter sp. TaxID=1967498 RepID=UPI003C4860C8
MRLVVDTGVFSAALSRRRRPEFEDHVARLAGNQLFLAASTVAELRYGALVAEWGAPRRDRLEEAIAATTVIPVSDALLSRWADLRFACRRAGHPLADSAHANDLWIATSAIHIAAGLISADAIFDDVPDLDLR